MCVELRRRAVPDVTGLRPPLLGDEDALGSLMFHAYAGTVDSEGESEAEAIEEVRRTFDGAYGEYGEFNLLCSRVVERDGRIVSATLVTRWKEQPFVAFSMTHPDVKRSGLSRACLVSAMNALIDAGETELSLMATCANVPAVTLYESLGFRAAE